MFLNNVKSPKETRPEELVLLVEGAGSLMGSFLLNVLLSSFTNFAFYYKRNVEILLHDEFVSKLYSS